MYGSSGPDYRDQRTFPKKGAVDGGGDDMIISVSDEERSPGRDRRDRRSPHSKRPRLEIHPEMIRDGIVYIQESYYDFLRRFTDRVNDAGKYARDQRVRVVEVTTDATIAEKTRIMLPPEMENQRGKLLHCDVSIAGLPAAVFFGSGFGSRIYEARASAAKDLADKCLRLGIISHPLHQFIGNKKELDKKDRLPTFFTAIETIRLIIEYMGRDTWPSDVMTARELEPHIIDRLKRVLEKAVAKANKDDKVSSARGAQKAVPQDPQPLAAYCSECQKYGHGIEECEVVVLRKRQMELIERQQMEEAFRIAQRGGPVYNGPVGLVGPMGLQMAPRNGEEFRGGEQYLRQPMEMFPPRKSEEEIRREIEMEVCGRLEREFEERLKRMEGEIRERVQREERERYERMMIEEKDRIERMMKEEKERFERELASRDREMASLRASVQVQQSSVSAYGGYPPPGANMVSTPMNSAYAPSYGQPAYNGPSVSAYAHDQPMDLGSSMYGSSLPSNPALTFVSMPSAAGNGLAAAFGLSPDKQGTFVFPQQVYLQVDSATREELKDIGRLVNDIERLLAKMRKESSMTDESQQEMNQAVKAIGEQARGLPRAKQSTMLQQLRELLTQALDECERKKSRRKSRSRSPRRRSRSRSRSRNKSSSARSTSHLPRIEVGGVLIRGLSLHEQSEVKVRERYWAQDMKTGKWQEGHVIKVTDNRPRKVHLQVGIATWKKELDELYKRTMC